MKTLCFFFPLIKVVAISQCIVHSWMEFYVHKLILSICRKRLFSLINDLPTLFDVVTGRKPIKDNKPSSDSGSKSRNGTKVHLKTVLICRFFVFLFLKKKQKWGLLQRSIEGQPKSTTPKPMEGSYEDEDEDEEEDEHGDTLCGICGGNYTQDEFWICCDVCERWYHGKCVKITPAKADSIKQYKCPPCCAKKGRQ